MAAKDVQTIAGFTDEPSGDQLQTLAKLLGRRWKNIARNMLPRRMEENEIEDIAYRQRDSIGEQATAMLDVWKREHGEQATVKCLYQALVDAGCTLAAEKVFGVLERTENDSTLASRLNMDDSQLHYLARDIGVDWPDLALALQIPEVEIEKIKLDLQNTDDRSYRILIDWYWDKGSRADFSMVVRALETIRSSRKNREAKPERESKPKPERESKPKKNFEKVFEVVVKCGPDRWYDIGLKLGFLDGQLNELVEGVAGGGQKLNKIIRAKVKEVGAEETERELLNACRKIPSPIYGIVKDKLDQ